MKVVVECYHDTALVRALGIPMRLVGHQNGKGNVLRQLAKCDDDAIGVVDADPGKQDSTPGEMAKYQTKQTQHGLTLMTHSSDTRKSLIVIGPALEEWLIARAEAFGLKLHDYALPESAAAMHKSPRYDKKPGFRNFLAALAPDDGMKTLKKWLAV